MTKAQEQTQKDRVIALIQEWGPRVGLADWRFKFRGESEAGQLRDNNFRTIMTCEPDWRYMEACVVAHLPQVADTTDAELEEMVVHELMHAHLDELKVEELDHEERVATALARAFIQTYREGAAA